MRLFLSVLFLLSLPTFAAEPCVQCAEIQAMVIELKSVEPNPLDVKTIEKQDQMIDKAGDLLVAAFKPKKGAKFNDSINHATARAILALMVVVTPYDNAILIPPAIIPHFRHHYGKKDGVFQKAMAELMAKNAFSEAEKTAMLEAYGFPSTAN
jgi:hypothetical protein